MKAKNDSKLFAFKLAGKTQEAKTDKQWTARKGVATAGCSGPWARADSWRGGRDSGMYC